MNDVDSDLKVRHLRKEFESPAGSLEVLRDVDLDVKRGQSVAITGPSGSGKSTLLYILGTLEQPSGGEVEIGGRNAFAMAPRELAHFRNENVGFVFQDHHLLPQCSVLENVLIPALAGKGAGDVEMARATELLTRVGLAERLEHRPAQLSGGERQRVAVCRSMINQPFLLLADEPTGNLDRANSDAIGTLMLELCTERNLMLVCVTHSEHLAARFPRHLELRDGALVDAH